MVSTKRLLLAYLGGIFAAGLVALAVFAAFDVLGYRLRLGAIWQAAYVAVLILIARTVKRKICPIPDFRASRRRRVDKP